MAESSMFYLYISHANCFTKTWRLCAGSDPSNKITLFIPYQVVVAWYTLVDHFKSYELFFYAIFLLPG